MGMSKTEMKCMVLFFCLTYSNLIKLALYTWTVHCCSLFTCDFCGFIHLPASEGNI